MSKDILFSAPECTHFSAEHVQERQEQGFTVQFINSRFCKSVLIGCEYTRAARPLETHDVFLEERESTVPEMES